VQVAGEVGDLLAGHRMLTGPAAESGELAGHLRVVQRRLAGAQSQLLIRTTTPAEPAPPGWQSRSVRLEELVLAYLRESGAAVMPGLAEVQADTRTEVQA
jgi:ABC-2 type transport system ATP-binding protein